MIMTVQIWSGLNIAKQIQHQLANISQTLIMSIGACAGGYGI